MLNDFGTRKVSVPGVITLGLPAKTIVGMPALCMLVLVGTISGLPAAIFFGLLSSIKITFGVAMLSLGTT